MAKLADALDSGSSESNLMQVQVLLSAPDKNKMNLESERNSNSKSVFFSKDWFGIEVLTI